MQENMEALVAGWFGNAYSNMNVGKFLLNAMGGEPDSIGATVKSAVMSEIGSYNTFFQGIGMAIALLFFLMAMIDLSTSERLTLEFFIKFFSKLVIALFLIDMAPELVNKIVEFGDAVMTQMSNSNGFEETDELIKQYRNYLETSDPRTHWILLIVQSACTVGLIYIISFVVIVVAYIVGFTRLLELGVRGAFMPIALGLIADDGWRGPGGRYIRKFIAVCVQGAALIVISTVSSKAMGMTGVDVVSGNDGGFIGLLSIAGLAFATISMMFKSIGIINDVFGA